MKNLKSLLALVCLLGIPAIASAQVSPYSDVVLTSRGSPAGGALISVCNSPGLATTGASVTSNIAILTMSSNPITAGFVANMSLTVQGFTGADTYYNGSFTILTVTSTQITYALVHANASASTNGTAFQTGTAAQACAPLSTIYSDPAGLVPITQPGFAADGLGNYAFYAAPGSYSVQFYGPVLTVRVKPINIPCIPSVTCAATNVANTWPAPQIFAKFNGSRVVDGTVYALTAAGIQSALNDQSSAGGGTVLIQPNASLSIYNGNPLTVSGSPINMGSTSLTIPSHVCLVGSALDSGTVLRWTATPSGAHGAGINILAATQYACVRNLTLSFSSGASAPGGISLDGDATHFTFFNTIRDVFINIESVGASGSVGILGSGALNSFSISLNTFDNVTVFGGAQAYVCQSCEGNFWKVQASTSGNSANAVIFQEVQGNDEIIDARIHVGGVVNTDPCYSNTGQGSMVRLTCDANGSALSDAPAAGGNTYILSLIGTATLGTLGGTSTATVNRESGGNQLITATIGPSGTQQHTIPAVASDTFALLNATQTVANKSTAAGPLVGTVASGTAAMTTALIAAGACGTTVTVSATNVLTTDTINDDFNTAVTAANNGLLIFHKWPTAGNVNFNYCNPGAAGVTPTAMTVNWNVVR